MAITCTPDALLASAKCFNCMDEKLLHAISTYLTCQWANASPPMFISSDIQITSSRTFTVAHGLGATPAFVRMVFKCIINDAGTGAVVGQEIDTMIENPGLSNPLRPAVIADPTNIKIVLPSGQGFPGDDGTWFVAPAGGGTGSAASPTDIQNHFVIKIYAEL